MADDETMKAGDNPADYNVAPVQEFLATADQDEAQRVLDAETAEGGQDRKGVREAAQARLQELVDAEDDGAGSVDEGDSAKPLPGSGDQGDLAKPLTEAVKAAEEKGYLGESQSTADLSQANPAVMGREE